MKIFFCIALLSTGMVSADWRSEQDPVKAKKTAMEYFWKPAQVSGKDVKLALERLNSSELQGVLKEMFFAWKDDEGNTFLHIIVLKSNNTELLKAVLSLGADTTLVNKKGETAAVLAKDKPKMADIFESHEHDAWGNKGYPVESLWSKQSIDNQRLLMLVLTLGVAYYGWGNYNSHNKSVLV